VALALVPWLIIVRRVGPPRVPIPYLVLGVGMAGVGALSLAWTSDVVTTILYTLVCVEAMVAFLMMVTFLRDAGPARFIHFIQAWLLMLVLGGVLLWIGVPGFQPPAGLDPASGDYISYFARFSHPFIGRSNNLAAVLLLLVPPLVAWAARTRHVWDIGVAAVAEIAFLLCLSRGAMLALAIGVAVYFVVERRHRTRTIQTVLWSLPVGVLAAGIGWLNPTVRLYFAARFSGSNVQARIDILDDALDGNTGNWSTAPGSVLPRWLLGEGGGIGRSVHNTFIQQVLSFGVIIGVLVGLGLVVTGVWWFRRHPTQLPTVAPIHGIGVIALLVSFLGESSFEGSLLRPLIWLGWGMLVAGALRPSVRTLPWATVSLRRRASKPPEGAPRYS
jgi:hypothetical protein